MASVYGACVREYLVCGLDRDAVLVRPCLLRGLYCQEAVHTHFDDVSMFITAVCRHLKIQVLLPRDHQCLGLCSGIHAPQAKCATWPVLAP